MFSRKKKIDDFQSEETKESRGREGRRMNSVCLMHAWLDASSEWQREEQEESRQREEGKRTE